MIHALHGNLGSAADWNALNLPGLSACDLWNDLESIPDLTMEGWGEHFVDSLDDPDPVLLGYSMGGRLALHAMTAAPEKWRGAILVSAHPGLDKETDRRARLADDREWARRARNLEWQTFLNSWNAQAVLAGRSSSSAQLPLEFRREAVACAFEIWSLGYQSHFGGKLGACHFPILWVTGEHDSKFRALATELKNTVPDFEHAVIPGCGHRVIFERPDELAAVIRDFQKRRL